MLRFWGNHHEKLLILIMLSLSLGFASAEVSCTGADLVGSSPDGYIAVCDDPQDAVCEQDFGQLCPAGFHLCSGEEYRMHNDGWEGTTDTPMLGEIQCREEGGAGHFSVWSNYPFSYEVEDNLAAGSGLPECDHGYGCNEQQYYALCCGGTSDKPGDSIPEFSAIGAFAAVAAICAFAVMRR